MLAPPVLPPSPKSPKSLKSFVSSPSPKSFVSSPSPKSSASSPSSPSPPSPASSSDGRAADVAEFEAAVVGFFVEAADLMGVPKSVAAIYGICFAAPEPLSFSDIEQKLDLSKGSISQGLRFLRAVGALREVSTPADRLDRFEPDMELRKLALHWLEERLQKQLNSSRTRLQAIGRSIPAGKKSSSKVLKSRLKALQSWHDRTRSLLPFVRTFLKLA